MSYKNNNIIYINEDADEDKYQILRNDKTGPNFDIYNLPKFSNNNFLLFLEKLYKLRVCKFTQSNIINCLSSFKYKDILDLIFKIGVEDRDETFINLLISTLYNKNIDILTIS